MDKNKVNTTEKMPTVPVEKVRKVTKAVENLKDDDTVTLEFILTALFPTVWKNIQKYSNDCYTSGYLAGLRDGKNENKGNN
jgi:hypothetical protein